MKTLAGLPNADDDPVPAKRLQELRTLLKPGSTEPALSNLYHDAKNNPVFYMIRPLSDGRFAVGVVRTRYLITLQQAIAFGDRGHAVMVDAKGQVIAHPFKDWVAASRDISGSLIPIIAAYS